MTRQEVLNDDQFSPEINNHDLERLLYPRKQPLG